MSFLSEPSPIHALYFCSCFAFLSNGDEERGAAAKLAEMIGKTDHEDGMKEIFLFILDFVSVFFWELFEYLNAETFYTVWRKLFWAFGELLPPSLCFLNQLLMKTSWPN